MSGLSWLRHQRLPAPHAGDRPAQRVRRPHDPQHAEDRAVRHDPLHAHRLPQHAAGEQEAQHVFSQLHARPRLVRTRPHDAPRQHTAQICAITRFDPCPTRPYDHHTTQPTSAQSTHHHPCARPRSSCAMRQSPAHSTHAAHAAHAPHAAHARAARTHERDAHAQPTPASIIAHQRMPGQACLLETRDPESTI